MIKVKVKVKRKSGTLRLRVCDNSESLPVRPGTARPGPGTGMKLIAGLAHQIGWTSAEPGTALSLEFNS